MFAVPSFFGYNTTFVSTPVATAATGVGETSFTANWNAFAGASYYLLDVSTSSTFSSFVGSYQNFVVISNSQVVSGLTSNTTYYYRLRAATGVDADAASFFSRVYTAGGALSYTEVSATETLVASLKANSLWTPMKAIYPMVGASAAACAQNLKSSSFTGTFTSGWTFASTGVTGNGTSAYFNTTFNPNTQLTFTDSHMSLYKNLGNISSTTMSNGVYATTIPVSFSLIPDRNNTVYSLGEMGSYSPSTAVGNNSSVQGNGFYVLARNANNFVRMTKNNTNTLSNTVTSSPASFPNDNIWLGGTHQVGTTVIVDPNTYRWAFMSLGNYLDATQASNFYTAVQAFQTTLGRQIAP